MGVIERMAEKATRDAVKGQNDRAQKRGVSGVLTFDEWMLLMSHFNDSCACCGRCDDYPFNRLQIDHVRALSRGGINTIENVQPLCQNCNLSKHTKSTDYRDASILGSFLRDLAKLRG
jgi:5-methylcytosine-specific restriction endonuclease McrA